MPREKQKGTCQPYEFIEAAPYSNVILSVVNFGERSRAIVHRARMLINPVAGVGDRPQQMRHIYITKSLSDCQPFISNRSLTPCIA